jgi:hypothetical protein
MNRWPLVFWLGVLSCTPQTTSKSPAVDGGVCAHLEAIGCPQGQGCEAVLERDQGKLVDVKPACLEAASTPGDAVKCGTVTCP